MVISVEIHNCIVKKTLIDQGSSADILYWNTFKQLGIPEEELTPYNEPLIGFAVKYIVVQANTSYNILLGRPSLNALGAIVSIPHLAMKFPSNKGNILTIHADQKAARECYFASLCLPPVEERQAKARRVHAITPQPSESASAWDLDLRLNDERAEPIEEKVPLQVSSNPSQVTYIGIGLLETERIALCKVIVSNKDLFAWMPSDMPSIDPEFMCHKLSICRAAKPVAQQKRKMGTERKVAVESEVSKLLQARFIREVQYTTWLENVVMVKKPNGKWRMCTDYTNLNKACPKDAYPLPNIDRLVDGASGHKLLTFLDAYSGYNQIRMYPQDEVNTAFITDSANYCYQVMPFRLKNAGATYQRLMDKVFKEQIGKNLEVYVDDMVVKSNDLCAHKGDLMEVFHQLWKHDMRLNPEKCVFGIAGAKFLGFMLSTRGIEANPDKCRLTSLSRFLFCLAETAKPIIRLLKKVNKFTWPEECQTVFQALKQRLGTPPILSKPDPTLDIIVYMCVSHEAISSVLIQEKETQMPIYFISQMLQDIDCTDCLAISEPSPTWMTDITRFITEGVEPTCPSAAKKLRTQAARYSVVGGALYRRGFSSPLLKCLDPEQANYVLREVHEGICGSHTGRRTLAPKVLRAGYYWPTLKTDCMEFVKKCAEDANKVILSELKKRLGAVKGAWAEELSEVLWAYRCTPQSTTQETPFRLTFGTDAMIPVEVGEPSFRRTHFDEDSNDASLRAEIDLVEEIRARAQVSVGSAGVGRTQSARRQVGS
uniref:Retrovirus-related Pol polyprotein from transposon 297 family n=1 Tax=Cajanus cajan TaxID=3821 RepID=A0A151RQ66_CAJCA|nr:Retrovirus-related Pol polyprotein from transposon 297 family [Cajanus cajan]